MLSTALLFTQLQHVYSAGRVFNLKQNNFCRYFEAELSSALYRQFLKKHEARCSMSRNWCEVLNFIFQHFTKTFILPENHLGKMNKCELEAFFINSLDSASVVNNLESAVVLLDKSQLN